MPFTVLKISKTADDHIEVVAEFSSEHEAHAFVEDAQVNESTNEYEYSVEHPPQRH
jgi:hypothetical protein